MPKKSKKGPTCADERKTIYIFAVFILILTLTTIYFGNAYHQQQETTRNLSEGEQVIVGLLGLALIALAVFLMIPFLPPLGLKGIIAGVICGGIGIFLLFVVFTSIFVW